MTYGSADSDTYGFDANSGQVTQYKFNVSTQSVTGDTTWNPNGSLKQLGITNQLNAADTQTCNYTHDDLARIATANCGSIWNQNFTYDAFGNIDKTATAVQCRDVLALPGRRVRRAAAPTLSFPTHNPTHKR